MPDEFAAAEKRSSLRTFAARVIACDERGGQPGGSEAPAAFHVCDRLRPHLTPLMGTTGYHALLSRALALARAEAPRLSEVQVKPDGSLGPKEPDGQLNPQGLAEAGALLVAQLIGLLDAFIGESLTLRMLRNVWPELSRTDIYFKT